MPTGEQHGSRRAIQLGLKGSWLEPMVTGVEVIRILDMTEFVVQQRSNIESEEKRRTLLMVPVERLYVIDDV